MARGLSIFFGRYRLACKVWESPASTGPSTSLSELSPLSVPVEADAAAAAVAVVSGVLGLLRFSEVAGYVSLGREILLMEQTNSKICVGLFMT